MEHPPQFTGVVPAPGCPHYITLRDAELGRIECPWCEAKSVQPRKYRGKRRNTTPDVGLSILDGEGAA